MHLVNEWRNGFPDFYANIPHVIKGLLVILTEELKNKNKKQKIIKVKVEVKVTTSDL